MPTLTNNPDSEDSRRDNASKAGPCGPEWWLVEVLRPPSPHLGDTGNAGCRPNRVSGLEPWDDGELFETPRTPAEVS